MGQSKIHFCHLIYAQISIDSFFLRKRIPSVTELNTEANPLSTLYHETVIVRLSSYLLQKGHNQMSGADDVANDLHQRTHRNVPGHNSTSQSMSKSHSVFVLSAFQSQNDELLHRKQIQTAKDN